MIYSINGFEKTEYLQKNAYPCQKKEFRSLSDTIHKNQLKIFKCKTWNYKTCRINIGERFFSNDFLDMEPKA